MDSLGDWVLSDGGGEYSVNGFITYQLPELPAGVSVASSSISLQTCGGFTNGAFTDASVIDSFGGILTVFLNNQFLSANRINTEINPNASVVADITGCENLDITEIVRNAYLDGFPIIQFRLSFDAPPILNDSIDVMIFEDPRLEILIGQ